MKKYRYFPDEKGKYNIPNCHNQYVQYGNNIKAICVNLMNHLYNSTDGVTRFIEAITNVESPYQRGTLILWNEEISNKLSPEVKKYKILCLILIISSMMNHR